MVNTVRPTKKQRELLSFIERFIQEHGYSPSYREIMNGLQYTSVATVALHINNLIKRGHIRKRDHSARSLEVISADTAESADTVSDALAVGIERICTEAESASGDDGECIEQLALVVHALRILGLESEADHCAHRLAKVMPKESKA